MSKVEFRGTLIELNTEINSFFNQDSSLISLFQTVFEDILKYDADIIVRGNGQIFGASLPKSRYHFYCSKDQENFYIKYQQDKEKIIFSPDNLEDLLSKNKDAVEIMKTLPALGDPAERKAIPKEKPKEKKEEQPKPERPPVVPIISEEALECDLILEKCEGILREYSQYKINPDIFSVRVYNRFKKNSISIYGDLLNLRYDDFMKMEHFGKKCLDNILDVLKRAEEDPQILINKRIEGKTEFPWMKLRERTAQIFDEVRQKSPDGEMTIPATTPGQVSIDTLYTILIEIIENILTNGTSFTEREREIGKRRIIDCETLAAIGKDYNLSRERIRQISTKVEIKIIRYLNDGEDAENIVDPIYHFFDAVPDDEYLGIILGVSKKNPIVGDLLIRIAAAEEEKEFLIKQANAKTLRKPKTQGTLTKKRARVRAKRAAAVSLKEPYDCYRYWLRQYPKYLILVRCGSFVYTYGSCAKEIGQISSYAVKPYGKKNIPRLMARDGLFELLEKRNKAFIVVQETSILDIHN